MRDWALECLGEDKYPTFEPGDLVTISSSTMHLSNLPPEQAIEKLKTIPMDDVRDITGVWHFCRRPDCERMVGLVVGYIESASQERFYFILVEGAMLTFPYIAGVRLLQSMQAAV